MAIEFRQRAETYLGEARYTEPKRVFVLLADMLEASGTETRGARFLDIGCATGELIFFLKQRFPGMQFSGVDNQPDLLARARTEASIGDVAFVEADAIGYRGEPQDFVACFGMLGIFDQFEPLLESLLANTRKGGRIFVQALLNDVDIDVRVYYRDHHNNKDWNRGYNVFSMKQISCWLESRVASWRFLPFRIDVDIPRRPDLPHRAYTRRLEDGQRITTNGLCMLLPETLLEITV